MYLIPTPQNVVRKEETITKREVVIANEISDERIKKAVSKLPISEGGIPLYITYNDTNEEGYRLLVSNEEIKIEGDGINGAFYGVQTLRQIFDNEEIFHIEIEDKPKNIIRGVYQDVTRGKVPTVETLKWLVDQLAFYKINTLHLYMEHAYPFREHYGTLDESCCLMPEDIKELDEYCKENFIDLVPSIATASHLFDLLNVAQNVHLREIKEYKPKYHFWFERQDHHTIDIENPEGIEFIKSLITQYAANFSSEYIHICGDEPFDLIRFGWREEAGIDVHKMYSDYMLNLIEYVKSLGKKPMVWGSVVKRDRPDLRCRIPEDVVVCNASYQIQPTEARFVTYEDQNFQSLVCPGTSSYYRLVENAYASEQNIRNISVFGHKYGSIGMLNTNWGDYGNPCSLELSMFGMVAGAQMSWDFENKLDDEFKRAINVLLYKNNQGYQYVYKTDRIHAKANYWQLVRYYSNCIFPGREIRWTQYPSVDDVREAAKKAKELYDELSTQKWERDEYRIELLSALYGTGVIAELFEKHMTGTEPERWTNTEEWLKKYRELWVKKNKESELFRIEEFFRGVEALPPQNKIFTYYGPEMD